MSHAQKGYTPLTPQLPRERGPTRLEDLCPATNYDKGYDGEDTPPLVNSPSQKSGGGFRRKVTEEDVVEKLASMSREELMFILRNICRTAPHHAKTIHRVASEEGLGSIRDPLADDPSAHQCHIKACQRSSSRRRTSIVNLAATRTVASQGLRQVPLRTSGSVAPWNLPTNSERMACSSNSGYELTAEDTESSTDAGIPIVQFAVDIHYCSEECSACLQVIRIGNLDKKSVVSFETKDCSAMEGISYEQTSGLLEFEPFEHTVYIEVPMVPNDDWANTLEFSVVLSLEGGENASLDLNLYFTRVKIINDDLFPTPEIAPVVQSLLDRHESDFESVMTSDFGPMPTDAGAQVRENINTSQCILEYMKMCMVDSALRNGTILIILADFLINLFYILEIFVSVYLVDHVLNTEFAEDELWFSRNRTIELLLVAFVKIIPFAIEHFLDYRRLAWRVVGIQLCLLQSSLIRQFLVYDASSRRKVLEADLVMALIRDTPDVVHKGFMTMLVLLKSICQLLLMFGYQMIAPLIFNKPFACTAQFVMIAFPTIQCTFMYCRTAETLRVIDDHMVAENKVLHMAQDIVATYHLIAAYRTWSAVAEGFEKLVRWSVRKGRAAEETFVNNAKFPAWLSLVFTSSYTVLGGLLVIQGTQSLGMFLANISVYKQIGHEMGVIHEHVTHVLAMQPAMSRVVTLLNLPSDLDHRNSIQERNVKIMHKGRGNVDHIDELHIVVGSSQQPGSYQVAQGMFVALVGKRGQKTVDLLRTLAGSTLDPHPTAFVPTHLRALHISARPIFVHGSLLTNLRYGVLDDDDTDGSIYRIRQVLTKLRAPSDITKALDDPQSDWISSLTTSSMHIVDLARALISNPEVLCIEDVLMPYDDMTAQLVLTALREFTFQKGLCVDVRGQDRRRPRTCLVTTSRMFGLTYYDLVLSVNAEGISEIDPKTIDVEDFQ